jgi:hypothetical protein
MIQSDLIKEIVGTYQKHGWQLRRLLLRPETRATLDAELAFDSLPLDNAQIEEASIDGLWFSRESHEEREAWELRLLAENPFALFETFEKDETEEQREEMRREMEARLRDYVNGKYTSISYLMLGNASRFSISHFPFLICHLSEENLWIQPRCSLNEK